eukprot:TRINITY_DN2516_c0_g1_i1.p1 TRINITY_DN2516_c0_g1~~TRINITY_DN2516_c0_g1_i1.p1  ORF type:complete len:1089 (+),score=35.59 TRINITY_DN2516_c0_g1_i1:457-3723(+)
MKSFFKILVLYPYLSSMKSSIFTVLIYGLSAVSILTFCLTLLSLLKSLQNSLLTTFTFYLADIQSRALYLPFLGTLALSLTCREDSGQWVSTISSKVKCYSMSHIAISVPSTFAVLALILLTTLCKAFVSPNKMDCHMRFAKQNSMKDIEFHFFRSILCILSVVLPEVLFIRSQPSIQLESKEKFLSILYGIFTLYLSWECMNKSWLYNKKDERLLRLCWVFNAWPGIALLLPHFFYQDVEYYAYGLFFIWPMVLGLVYYYSDLKLIPRIVHSYKTLKDTGNYMGGCIILSRLITETDKETIYLLNASIDFQFIREANKNSPALAAIEESIDGTGQEKSNKFMAYLLNKRIRAILVDNPTSVSLKIFYIKFLMKTYHNYSLAWVLTGQAASLPSSWTEQFLLYSIKKELASQSANARRNNKKRTQMNAIAFLRQSQIEGKFRGLIERAARLYSRFWDLLQEKSPSCEQFEELGFEILRVRTKIRKSWSTLVKGKSIQGETAGMYGKFALEVDQDKVRSREIIDWLSNLNVTTHNDLLMNYAGNGAGVVTLVGKVEGLGKISKCNGAFAALTGYLVEELEQLSILELMPRIYRKVHKDEIIQMSAMLDVGDEDFYRTTEKRVFVLNKSQCLVPVIIKVMEAPSLLNNYVFIATVTIDKEWNKYNLVHLLLNLRHEVIGFTPSIICVFQCKIDAKPWLNLGIDNLSETLNINQLIPSITSVNMTEYKEVGVVCQDKKKIVKEFPCRYEKVTTKKGIILGYHIFLRTNFSKPKSPLSHSYRNYPFTEFRYDHKTNKFYTEQNLEWDLRNCSPTSSLASNRFPISTTKITSESKPVAPCFKSTDCLRTIRMTPEPLVLEEEAKSEQRPTSSPGQFHQALLSQLKSIADKTGDSSLYERTREKTNYAEEVTTYRIVKDKIVKVQKNGDLSAMKAAIGLEFEELSDQKHRKKDFATDKVIKSTIKSKDYLTKLLQNMPLSPAFNRLAIIITICITIASGIGVAEYVILKSLFDNMYTEFDAILVQFIQGRNIYEISTWTTQLIAVKEYTRDNKQNIEGICRQKMRIHQGSRTRTNWGTGPQIEYTKIPRNFPEI